VTEPSRLDIHGVGMLRRYTDVQYSLDCCVIDAARIVYGAGSM